MKYICIAISTIILCGLVFSACDRNVNIIRPMTEVGQSNINQDQEKNDSVRIPVIQDGIPAVTGFIGIDPPNPNLKPYDPKSDTNPEKDQEGDVD